MRKPSRTIREYLADVGRKGGKARTAGLSPEERPEIARGAARARGIEARNFLLAAEGGPWTTEQVAKHLRITRQGVDRRRRANKLTANMALSEPPSDLNDRDLPLTAFSGRTYRCHRVVQEAIHFGCSPVNRSKEHQELMGAVEELTQTHNEFTASIDGLEGSVTDLSEGTQEKELGTQEAEDADPFWVVDTISLIF